MKKTPSFSNEIADLKYDKAMKSTFRLNVKRINEWGNTKKYSTLQGNA